MKDYKKGITLADMNWSNGQIRTVGKIQKLYDLIQLCKKDGKPRTITMTYSFPRAGSTFPSHVLGADGKPKSIITTIEESPIPLRDLGRTLVKAFKEITDVIHYDFPLIKIKIKKAGRGYEKQVRFLDYMNNINTNYNKDIGDIKVFWMPLNNSGRLAECASEYATEIDETSNAGLSLILNTEAKLLLDDDMELFKFRTSENNIKQNRYSLLSVLIHELLHKFGFGHAPEDGKFRDTVCYGNQRISLPHGMRFRNGLFDDYYVRLGLSTIYQYSLDNSIIREDDNS